MVLIAATFPLQEVSVSIALVACGASLRGRPVASRDRSARLSDSSHQVSCIRRKGSLLHFTHEYKQFQLS
jgi:hypothetical protein